MLIPKLFFFSIGYVAMATLSPVWARAPVVFTSPCTCEGNHGVERWTEKTDVSEPPSNKADIRSITPATMAMWGDAGGGVARNSRQGLETLFFSVTGRVTKVKVEDDGDLHLSLEDLSKPGRVVVEIPLGERWCELRKKVFSWSDARFPVSAGKPLELTRQPVVSVVGKAFYDAGHASSKNRRSYDAELAVWEIHPVMELTESTTPSPHANAAPQGESTPPAATSTVETAAPQKFVVLAQPVRIRIAYGETTLPAGMKLSVVSHSTGTVNVRYLNQVYAIPAGSIEEQ
jgi:hypothetical protein